MSPKSPNFHGWGVEIRHDCSFRPTDSAGRRAGSGGVEVWGHGYSSTVSSGGDRAYDRYLIFSGRSPGFQHTFAHASGIFEETTNRPCPGIIVEVPGRKPFVLVVLTRGIADEPTAHKMVARIAQIAFDRATGKGK
jgi:hypothetical protein